MVRVGEKLIFVFWSSLGLTGGYLISPILGFGISIAFILGIVVFSKRSTLEQLLKLLVITLPLYTTPIISGLPPIFSWTTLFLIVLSILLIPHGRSANALADYLFFIFILVGIFTATLIDLPSSGLYYFAQILLFIVPALIAYRARDHFRSLLPANFDKSLLLDVACMITSMSIGVIIQWALRTYAGISIGYISEFQSRITFDLTIPAFSVMSGVLSLGIIIAPMLWRIKMKSFAVFLPLLSTIAILVNSSRTGIFAAVITLFLAILFPPKEASKVNSRLLIIPAALFTWLIFKSLSQLERFSQSEAILDDNGRFETIFHSLNEFKGSTQNFLVGLGYTHNFGISPHNSIIETLVKSGAINFSILVIWIALVLIYLRQTDWFYLLFTLIVGSMFYSGFYAVKVFTVVAILGIIARSIKYSPDQKLSQTQVKVGSNSKRIKETPRTPSL